MVKDKKCPRWFIRRWDTIRERFRYLEDRSVEIIQTNTHAWGHAHKHKYKKIHPRTV